MFKKYFIYLGYLFILLKITTLIDWNWWVVLLPLTSIILWDLTKFITNKI
jgi:hypothetical protein|tara:strand:- start:3086 stop:3235 length:150 start_codon:yes stop_codon:yes gene_type:complete